MIDKNGDIWSCIVCGKVASDPKTKANLKRHTETHIKDIPWPCNICGKVSGSKSGLTQHKAKYHKDLKEDAPTTPKSPLDTSIPYDSVINSMIEKQGEVWSCTKCGKTAVDARAKFNLKRHIEVHIEGVAYNCEICGKSSGSKNGLAQHKAKYHRSAVFTSTTTAASTSASTSSSSSIVGGPGQETDNLPIAKRSRPVSPIGEKKMKVPPRVEFKMERLPEPQQIEPLSEHSQQRQMLHTPQVASTPSLQFLSAPTMQLSSPTGVQFNLAALPQHYSTAQYTAAAAQYSAVLNNAVQNSRVQFNFN